MSKVRANEALDSALPAAGIEPTSTFVIDPPLPAAVGLTTDRSAAFTPMQVRPEKSAPAEMFPVVPVHDRDWQAIRNKVDAPAIRARMRLVVEQMESLLTAPTPPTGSSACRL